MHLADHNHPVTRQVVRALALVALVFAMPSGTAHALDTGDIIVASTRGEVHFTVRGAASELRAGAVLPLPATVRTGRDGAVELRQGGTSISVGPETLLEFPAPATPGGSIDRVMQPSGNAFYDVGKRGARKLRVETPFLVGVVKGTQFNVAAQEHGTTISLFEGLLEVRSSDGPEVIDLHAGEIAIRDRGAATINVLEMEGNSAPPRKSAPAPSGDGKRVPVPSPAPDVVEGAVVLAVDESGRRPVAVPPVVEVVPGSPAPVDTGVSASVGVDVGVDRPGVVDLSPGVSLQAEPIVAPVEPTTGAVVQVDLGNGPGAQVEVSVDTPSGNAIDVSVDVTPGAGGANVDVSVDTPAVPGEPPGAANVDLGGIGAGVSVDVDTGAGVAVEVPVDTGPKAGVDPGSPAVNVDVNSNAQGGPLSMGLDAGAAVNLGGDIGAANVDLGVDVGVGNVAGLELDAGLDTGIGNGNGLGLGIANGNGNGPPADTGSVVEDVVDVIDGLITRPGKK